MEQVITLNEAEPSTVWAKAHDLIEEVSINEALEQDSVPLSRRILNTRTFRLRRFAFSSRVAESALVVPFKIGDFVPLEALNTAWQRDHRQTGNSNGVAWDMFTSIYRVGSERPGIQMIKEKILPTMVLSPNIDERFRHIIPFSTGEASSHEAITQAKKFFSDSPAKALLSLLYYIEKKSMGFYNKYGLLSLSQTKQTHGSQSLHSLSRIDEASADSYRKFTHEDLLVNQLGTFYENDILKGCICIPKNVYMYQYGRLNVARRPRRNRYHKKIDQYDSSNSFFLVEQDFYDNYSSTIDEVLEILIHEYDQNYRVIAVPSITKAITGQTLNFKQTIFQ